MNDKHMQIIAAMDEFYRDYQSITGDDPVDLAMHATSAFNAWTHEAKVPRWILCAAKMIVEIYKEQDNAPDTQEQSEAN